MGSQDPASRTICYSELWTADVEQSKQFYCGLFGWSAVASSIGEDGSYHIFKDGERELAGLLKIPEDDGPDAPSPHWLNYVLVDDVDAMAEQAAALGGTVRVPPADIPGIDASASSPIRAAYRSVSSRIHPRPEPVPLRGTSSPRLFRGSAPPWYANA